MSWLPPCQHLMGNSPPPPSSTRCLLPSEQSQEMRPWLSLFALPCFMEQDTQEIRQLIIPLPMTFCLKYYGLLFLDDVLRPGIFPLGNYFAEGKTALWYAGVTWWKCEIDFCFTATVRNLTQEDVWKIQRIGMWFPFPWSWFVTSSFVDFISLQTLALQNLLFTHY